MKLISEREAYANELELQNQQGNDLISQVEVMSEEMIKIAWFLVFIKFQGKSLLNLILELFIKLNILKETWDP